MIDITAEICGNIVSDFFRQAVREIDRSFGEGFSKQNPTLVASYMKAAAIKNHGHVVGEAITDACERLAHAIDTLTV